MCTKPYYPFFWNIVVSHYCFFVFLVSYLLDHLIKYQPVKLPSYIGIIVLVLIKQNTPQAIIFNVYFFTTNNRANIVTKKKQ